MQLNVAYYCLLLTNRLHQAYFCQNCSRWCNHYKNFKNYYLLYERYNLDCGANPAPRCETHL